MLKKLKKHTSRFPGLLPRYLHMTAYMHKLNGSDSNARSDLLNCIQTSLKNGNRNEASWAEHSQSVWFDPTHPMTQDEFWQRSTEEDLDWHVASTLEPDIIKFTLPLPK